MESMSTLVEALHAFQDYYAKQIQLQEVLEASLYRSNASKAAESDSSSSSDEEEEYDDKDEDYEDEDKSKDEYYEDENEDENGGDYEDETKNEDEEKEDEDENEDELGSSTEENNSQTCPGCGATVGRRFDCCIHMICWCQFEFCYICGERWDEDHFDTCEEE